MSDPTDPIDAALLELQRAAAATNPALRRLGAIAVDTCEAILRGLAVPATVRMVPVPIAGDELREQLRELAAMVEDDPVGATLSFVVRAQDMIEALSDEQRAELEQRMAEHRLSQIGDGDDDAGGSEDAGDDDEGDEDDDDGDEEDEGGPVIPADLDDMTRGELQAFAREHQLDVDLRRGADDLRDAIRAALTPTT